jgi:hypothetical protein
MSDTFDYSTFDDDLQTQIDRLNNLNTYINNSANNKGDDYDSLLRAIGISPTSTGQWDSPTNKQILQDAGYTGNFNASDIGNFIKKTFTNASDGSLNIKALGAVAGAGLGLAGLTGAKTTPTGYQGGIPKLTATQPMLTAPPTGRRPGSGGINYGTGVQYKDEKGNIVSDTSTSVADLLAAAKANPFNQKDTYGVVPTVVPRAASTQTFVAPKAQTKAVVDESVNSAKMIADRQAAADKVNAEIMAKNQAAAKAKADEAAKIQADAAAAAAANKAAEDAKAKAIVDAQAKTAAADKAARDAAAKAAADKLTAEAAAKAAADKAAQDAAAAAAAKKALEDGAGVKAASEAAAKAAADKAAADKAATDKAAADKAAAAKAVTDKAAADKAASDKAAADAAFAKTPEGMAQKIGVALPTDWSKLGAQDKIDFFNAKNIDPSKLLTAGVSQADIDWMTQHGYNGKTINQGIAAGTALPTGWNNLSAQDKIASLNKNNVGIDALTKAGTSASDLDWMAQHGYNGKTIDQAAAAGVSLPTGWNNLGAKDKIDYLNTNKIGADALTKAGTSTADLDWMKQNGYTGGVAPAAAAPASLALPSDFSSFNPNQKIDYFNQNKIGASQLADQGVSQADIDWMKAHGYQGMAQGGITTLNHGGFVIPADVVSHFGNGSSEAGLKLLQHKLGATPIKGHGDGMSDSIPASIDGREKALVANEEAYVSPKMVERLGDGDMDAGSRKLKHMMEQIRKARTGSKDQGKQVNPERFMPGGLAAYAAGGAIKRFADGATVTGAGVNAGVTGTEQNLSNWVGPYATNILAKGEALVNTPYQAYTGPLTAGQSGLQTSAFTAANNLTTPSSIGTAAANANALGDAASQYSYTPTSFSNQFFAPTPYTTASAPEYAQLVPQNVASTFQAPEATNAINFTTGMFGNTEAQAYMNPYLRQSLDPQLAEARRQAEIQAQADQARATAAGAFGGGRQALMASENRRNLNTNLANITGQGYNTAYTNAMGQYNQDQARSLQAQQAQESARQANQNYGLTAATTAGEQGLKAALANQSAGLTAGQGNINAALDAAKQVELSRQFGASQAMTAADKAANYGMQAAQATENSNQFANSQGLAGLSLANSAYMNAGNLGALQNATDLSNIKTQADLGATQRTIEAEGIAADKKAFEEAQKDPYSKLLFEQALLNGMPITAQDYNMAQLNPVQAAAGGATTVAQLLAALGLGNSSATTTANATTTATK